MENVELLHKANIVLHILAGTSALLIGIAILWAKKGNRWHVKTGKIFLYLLAIVIFTALFGVFTFGRNTFLLVITILSGYQGFSGYRILKTKSNAVHWIDILAGIVSLAVVSYFLYYFQKIGFYWAPVIIYSTVGTLILFIMYDFLKYFIPKSTYKNLWLYEHIIKMIGAFSALLAAFSGTVFSDYKPWSQILPSVLGVALQIGFVWYYAKNTKF
jgi:hypothetical protein